MSESFAENPAGIPEEDLALLNEASGGRITRDQWMTLAAAFLGWTFDGMEMGIAPLVARPALTDLLGTVSDGDIGRWYAYLTALFLIGAALGGVIFGWMGDRIGRVRAMTISILFYSVFTGLGYFSTEAWHLGACRFIAALGMGGEWSLGVALVMECWPAKHRPILAGLIGAASNVGFGLIAVVALFIDVTAESWRWVMLAGAAPAGLTFFIRLFVPESERWVKSVATRAAHPMKEVFSGELLKTTLLAIGLASVALIGTWGAVQWITPWADQLSKGDPSAKAMMQIMLAIGAVIGCMGGAMCGGWFGRRPTYFFLCLGSLGVCAYMFRMVSEYGTLFLILGGLIGALTAAFYGWLPLYLPELFPTRVRATGQGVSFNFGRILAAVGALQMGALMEFYDGSYAKAGASLSLVYIVGLVLIWFCPETRGKPLPE